MNFDIKACTIFCGLTGSRLYGTDTADSDYDYRGVAIPPLAYFLGYKSHFEQYEGSKEDDTVIYALNKFLKLAADNNPNVIELLYIPESHWSTASPEWERLVAARDLFLSKKAYSTFRGYAHAQLKRIETHRGWLMQGELTQPTREQFGLPPEAKSSNSQVGAALELVNRFTQSRDIEHGLAEVAKLGAKAEAIDLRQQIWDFLEQTLDLGRTEIEAHVADHAMERIGFDTNMIDRLQREKSYIAAKRHYESWLRWKRERNAARKEMEAAAGYDCKHAYSLIRLLMQCEEILVDHTMTFPCRNVEFLRNIRSGNVAYENVMAWAKQQEENLDELKQTTTLRSSPDRNAIEDLGINLVQTYHR